MGYSMNDLNNAADNVKNALEERSQRKGQELANQVLHGNLIGFLFARWFNFLTLSIVIALLIHAIFDIDTSIAGVIAIIPAIFVLRTNTFWYMGFWKAIGIFTGLFIVASLLDSL